MKLLIRIYSSTEIFKNWLIRLALIALAVISLTHFNENPNGLLMFSAVLIAISFLINNDQVSVFDIHWEKTKLFAWGLIKQKTKYNYVDLITVDIENDSSQAEKLVHDVIRDRYFQNYNRLILTYKDNQTEAIKIRISASELRKAVELINQRTASN
jgi:hypothetical protein